MQKTIKESINEEINRDSISKTSWNDISKTKCNFKGSEHSTDVGFFCCCCFFCLEKLWLLDLAKGKM